MVDEYDQAFEEKMRLRELHKKIEKYRKTSEKPEEDKEIAVLEREATAIENWFNGRRDTPTTGHPVLAELNLQSNGDWLVLSEDPHKASIENYLFPEVWSRIESEGKTLDKLSHSLQEEIKKLVASLAEEKQGAVSNILLIGNTTDNQLETFLAATKAALEIVGHSRLVDQSTGADDLIARFRKADFSKSTTYEADSRRHRHWVIEQLEAFPFTVGANNSGFAKIQNAARIVATASPNSQTPLPREIEELFKIKVDCGMPFEDQADNGGEVAAALTGAPPAKEERERVNGYKEIAELVGVSDRMAKNYARTKGFPLHKETNGRVYTFKDELLEWHKRHEETFIERRKERARKRGKRK